MKLLITNNLTGITEEVEIPEVESVVKPELVVKEQTLEERVAQVETETVTLKTKTVTLEQTLDVLFGGAA